jgi:hypothetical protein
MSELNITLEHQPNFQPNIQALGTNNNNRYLEHPADASEDSNRYVSELSKSSHATFRFI